MYANLYFILGILWAMVCKKEGDYFQLNSIVQWHQNLIFDHPLREFHQSMQSSDAENLINYLNSRTENKESVIQMHSTEAVQAISILFPDAWEKFLKEKIEKNETSCGLRPSSF